MNDNNKKEIDPKSGTSPLPPVSQQTMEQWRAALEVLATVERPKFYIT